MSFQRPSFFIGVLVREWLEDLPIFAQQTRFLEEAALFLPELPLVVVTPRVLIEAEFLKGERSLLRVHGMVPRREFSFLQWELKEVDIGVIYDRFFPFNLEQQREYQALLKRLQAISFPLSNPPDFLAISSDKWASYRIFRKAALLTPRSFLLSSADEKSWGTLCRLCEDLSSGYLKARYGSKGLGIYRWHRRDGGYLFTSSRGERRVLGDCVNGLRDLLKGAEKISKAPFFGEDTLLRGGVRRITLEEEGDFIVQPDLGVDGGEELRLWLQRDEEGIWAITAAVLREGRSGAIVANLARGGRYRSLEERGGWKGLLGRLFSSPRYGREALFLHEEMSRLLRRLEEILGKDVFSLVSEFAVDLIRGKEGWFTLEINGKPGRNIQTSLASGTSELRIQLVKRSFLFLRHVIFANQY